MAVKSKTQLQTDIAASTFGASEQVILDDIVDSYEDVFSSVTTVQRDALTPSAGDIIYNTDNNRYEYWNGSAWFGIGQDLSTPLTVKVSLSSAEILALDTVPKVLVSAYGSGYAILPTSLAYRLNAGGTPYSGTYFIYLRGSTSASITDAYTSLSSTMMNAAANRSGVLPSNTGTSVDAIVENDDIELKASAAISAGNGTLDVWLTYAIIVY